jgi:hypothetical protein
MLSGFTVNLCRRLRSTINYKVDVDLYTSQITTAHAKPQSFIVFLSCCLVTDLSNGDSSASVLTPLPVNKYCSHEITAPTSLVITSRRGPHRKHPVSNRNSIVACVFVASGTCIPSRCRETVAA